MAGFIIMQILKPDILSDKSAKFKIFKLNAMHVNSL